MDSPDRTVVEAVGLSRRFGGLVAVDRVDLRVGTGQVHGLLGPNGAGKTTLLRMLLGLVRSDEGTLRVLGRPLAGGGIPQGVAGFVETPAFYPYLSARCNLELLAALDGDDAVDRIDAALSTVDLVVAARRRVRGFSLGMCQRLGIAAALVRDPRLLVLDEPTNGLDPAGARQVRLLVRRLAEEGRTVLLSSHHMGEVEALCDAVTVLRAGRVVYTGTVDGLRERGPVPAYRLHTGDDATARSAARDRDGVAVAPHPDGGLAVRARQDALDGYVIALGRRGVAVRGLHRDVTSLESLFLRLTGAADTGDGGGTADPDSAGDPGHGGGHGGARGRDGGEPAAAWTSAEVTTGVLR